MPARREFLHTAGGAVLATVAGPALAAGTTAGSGPRFCFFSKHLPDLAWGDLASAAIDMGFDGVDLTVRPKGHVLPERVTADLPRAVEAIRAKGTAVAMITTEVTSASQPAAAAIFAAAAGAGVRLIKVGYWKYALTDVRAEVAAMGRDLGGLAALAATHGVTLGVHNHEGNVGSALWEIAPHLEALDARAIGYYFDPRHALAEGGTVGWKAATLLTLPRLQMIAVKDARWEQGPQGWRFRHCPMGEGMVDWSWFASTITRAGFSGPVSVHVEYAMPGTTPDEIRRHTMAAARRDLEFTRRAFATAGAPGRAG
jgi:L-ribulose-5-phosphate 3-epimerase